MEEVLAGELTRWAEAQPPWNDPARPPAGLETLAARLPGGVAAGSVTPGLIFSLPHGLAPSPQVAIVRSDQAEGERLLARLESEGMPAHLAEAGFVSLDDLWAPWCAAIVGGSIAAMCFAARIGPRGLEAGVYTFPDFRRRGLAAAVTAAWSSLPELADRTLFYSTSLANRSSQRVAQRLGLRRFAVGLGLA